MTQGDAERREMVRLQIERRGVRDPRVLEAMRTVPREAFVRTGLEHAAFDDRALPLDSHQTISQPYVVAAMIEALGVDAADRVLEIGAGSGYAAAVLATLTAEVFAIERFQGLATQAAARLSRLGYANVRVRCADGSRGWPEHAPFDAILVSAGAPTVPPSLVEQLTPGGRLVLPLGEARYDQMLYRITKREDGTTDRHSLGRVRFVPLIGEEGFEEEGT